MSELTRRGVVAGMGTVAALSIAGCLGDDEDDVDEEPTDASDGDEADGIDEPDEREDDDGSDGAADTDASGSSGSVLGEIAVENLADGTHAVDVIVEFDGEIEHWSSHDLEAGGEGVTIEPDWPVDAGEFRVTIRLDEAEFTQVTPERWNDPDCLSLLVLVGRDGGLRITGDTASGACETED